MLLQEKRGLDPTYDPEVFFSELAAGQRRQLGGETDMSAEVEVVLGMFCCEVTGGGALLGVTARSACMCFVVGRGGAPGSSRSRKNS